MKTILKICGYTLLVLLMAAAVGTYLAPRFGWHVDAVSSGSMEPLYGTGSVVIARPVPAADISIGDVITFRAVTSDASIVTHRVVGIVQRSPLRFRTQGDANPVPDPFSVPAGNVLGQVVYDVPFIGYLIGFLKTTAGYAIGLLAPALILLFVMIRVIWRGLTEDTVKVAG